MYRYAVRKTGEWDYLCERCTPKNHTPTANQSVDPGSSPTNVSNDTDTRQVLQEVTQENVRPRRERRKPDRYTPTKSPANQVAAPKKKASNLKNSMFQCDRPEGQCNL